MRYSTPVLAALMAGTAALIMPATANARSDATYAIDLPAQDLGDALRAIAARAGWQLYADAAVVNGLRAPALKGTMTPREAIRRLIEGSRLTASFSDRTVTIRGREQAAAEGAQIVVTGSHIRGAQVAAQVTRVTRRDIEDAGQTDLGEAMRALPQNFGGGQNPGVGFGAGSTNSNVNAASSINLRGLGPDATLTLLDGHRLPYNSAVGGVDVSAIPVAAIERVEIVADGASAVYGSDAVAGVANVILRRDFEGLTTSAQVGASSDGGYARQQADAVAGLRWSGGGLILAYDYAHNSAIRADQRDYASVLKGDNSLYPEIRQHAVTLAAHQDFGGGVTLSLDGLFSSRTSGIIGGTTATSYLFAPRVQTWTLAPRLDVALGDNWTLSATGAFGEDRTHYDTTIAPAGAAASITTGCFCNSALTAEVNANGALFSVGGGDARLALGAGYRDNRLDYTQFINASPGGAFNVSRHSTYAYGELYLPIFGPDRRARGIRRLDVSAALRYEDYPGMARIATPRVGLVYEPVRGLAFKGAWSRAFKAPTLYQQYIGYQAYLLPASPYGVGSAGSTIVYASGGNPDLVPERSRNWSLGLSIEPAALPGFLLEASWFDISYRDRVAEPLPGSIGRSLTDPAYASLVDFTPGLDTLAGVIAGARNGLVNYSGAAYDPATVVALLDDRNTNIAAQSIHGIDVHAAWRRDLGRNRSLAFDLAGSWLESHQQLTSALPATQLAGTVFNPPNLRARASGSYRSRRSGVSLYANYIGALTDTRYTPSPRIGPRVTIDLATKWDLIPGPSGKPGLRLSLVVNNLFNVRPPETRTTGPTDTPYESTNYSPIGRFIALGVTRNW